MARLILILFTVTNLSYTVFAQAPPAKKEAIVDKNAHPVHGFEMTRGQTPDAAMKAALEVAAKSTPKGQDPAPLKARIFVAKKIITMDPMHPECTAVATLGGRILALGTLEQVEDRVKDMPHERVGGFEDAILYPGFIESHAHAQTAGLEWMTLYLGQMKQMRPDGVMDTGPQTVAEIKARIKKEADSKKEGEWIFGFGYDPSILKYVLTNKDLDEVTGDRPMFILDASMHQAYVNSAALKLAGFDKDTKVEGVKKGANGEPDGRIEELTALKIMISHFPAITKEQVIKAQWTYAKLCNLKGITTIADMNFGMVPHGYAAAAKTAKDPKFPVRLSAYMLIDVIKSPKVEAMGGFDLVKVLQSSNNDMFRIAGVKFVMDGSNQGRTGVFQWPYYYDGSPNGVYNYDPAELERDLVQLFRRGIQPTIHVNADLALQKTLIAARDALREQPTIEHRTVLQHVQVASDEQFKLMKRLGISPNFLINHVYYWGDDWLSGILGPFKGPLVNAAGTAKRNGLRFGLHSDHPVTPIDRLLAMWVATNRQTSSGKVIGPNERITILDALKAVTIDAAFLLGEEHEKGSIVIGKLADFTVLDRDILEADAKDLRKAKIMATVLGGRVHKTEDVSKLGAPND